jgi:hypothetical protein
LVLAEKSYWQWLKSIPDSFNPTLPGVKGRELNKVAVGMSQIELPKMRQLLSLFCVYVERAARM